MSNKLVRYLMVYLNRLFKKEHKKYFIFNIKELKYQKKYYFKRITNDKCIKISKYFLN